MKKKVRVRVGDGEKSGSESKIGSALGNGPGASEGEMAIMRVFHI